MARVVAQNLALPVLQVVAQGADLCHIVALVSWQRRPSSRAPAFRRPVQSGRYRAPTNWQAKAPRSSWPTKGPMEEGLEGQVGQIAGLPTAHRALDAGVASVPLQRRKVIRKAKSLLRRTRMCHVQEPDDLRGLGFACAAGGSTCVAVAIPVRCGGTRAWARGPLSRP